MVRIIESNDAATRDATLFCGQELVEKKLRKFGREKILKVARTDIVRFNLFGMPIED